VKEIMKTQVLTRGGYSEELAAQVRRARNDRTRTQSDGIRGELLEGSGVSDKVKDILQRGRPGVP
jgi:hypothetical protein